MVEASGQFRSISDGQYLNQPWNNQTKPQGYFFTGALGLQPGAQFTHRDDFNPSMD